MEHGARDLRLTILLFEGRAGSPQQASQHPEADLRDRQVSLQLPPAADVEDREDLPLPAGPAG